MGADEASAISPADIELRAALCDLSPAGEERLRGALARMCAEAHAGSAHMEDLVTALKSAWAETSPPADFSDAEWHERYSGALVELLALYFGEPPA
jgi:hypothetical protein